jgi:Putative quorum-sensing-regulated virulence factor
MNDDVENVKMPFGKYRGMPLAEVPMGYLRWLLDHVELRPPLLGHVHRFVHGTEPPETLAEQLDRIMRASRERRENNNG